MRLESSSQSPGNRPGARIVIDPSIEQPENVFTPESYREFLRRWNQVGDEYDRLYDIDLTYPTAQERLNSPEAKQMKILWEQLGTLTKEYYRRLPIQLLARCPYCGSSILKPVDTFSLMGCYPMFSMDILYHGGADWVFSKPPQKRCEHALVATFAVNLNGLAPDDLSAWISRGKSMPLDSDPTVIVWPLVARLTSAVIHALPVGRLDDPEPIHRYTAYFLTYFASSSSNLYDEAMWVPTDVGRPATGAVEIDDNLVKWVRAGRLFWLDPNDPAHPLVRGPAKAFPYGDIRPKGWYEILVGGKVNGPHPYYRIWKGAAPPHDKSLKHTIEEL